MPKAKKKSPEKPPQANAITDEPKRSASDGAHTSRYDEQQHDEIEVLQSIFPEDFEQLETKAAWSKKSEKSFRLKLIADSDSALYVDLTVTFTATYPKTLPLLSLQCSESVPAKTREKVQYVVDTRPRELAGEVMILELSNDVRDTLEDAAQALAAGRAVPSLEEQRASQEAEVERLAREEEERELVRIEREKAEEERAMQQLVEDEVRRRDALRQKQRPSRSSQLLSVSPSDIVFDQPIQVARADGNPIAFQSVAIVKSIGKGPVAEAMEVRGIFPNSDSTGSTLPCMTLKRFQVHQNRARKSILDLEDDLEKLRTLSHENLLSVYDFKMTHTDNLWQFDVLLEEALGSSINDVLHIVESVPATNGRAYATNILQALDYLHKNGLMHGALHTHNIFICSAGNSRAAKLADACFQQRFYQIAREDKKLTSAQAKSARPKAWEAPETLGEGYSEAQTRKRDIWDFGVILAQMLLGADVLNKYQPQSLLTSGMLSEPLRDLLRDALRSDPRKRPSAFDLTPYEFLRTDCDAIQRATASMNTSLATRRRSSNQGASGDEPRQPLSTSRYANEWFEAGRLGKGGYGEVVKARNKLDGRVYAIKKITSKTQAQLSEVLSEVYLLATLNHPYVVRYYGAWPEEETMQKSLGDDVEPPCTPSSDTDESSSVPGINGQANFDFSRGGLDFISSSGYPKIEFDESEGSDSDAEQQVDGSDSDDDDSLFERDPASPHRSPKAARTIPQYSSPRVAPKATLYIQMEFCEKLTLRDIIRRNVQDNVDETWRILRQVVEGLAHVHSHGIIHRDLKPENIFIDYGNNPKIGDFGLATTGQTRVKQNQSGSTAGPSGDMTLSVGTALYVAPEVQSSGSGNYSEKVDMYSLGIIFFEMCCPLPTAMERGHVLAQLRQREHSLPAAFQSNEKQGQGDVILSLVKHKPSERPSSTELLRSGKIPVRIEDEQIWQTLSSLADPASPYFTRMMEALFAQSSNSQLQDRLWDQGRNGLAATDATEFVLLQTLVKNRMTDVFRRYGAMESSRQGLFPKSEYYSNADCAHFLDISGTTVQLPYDLIFPHARAIASQANVLLRSFAFGTVSRASPVGGAPRSNREADFDIISRVGDDTTLAEAEVIKCLDDLVQEFPCFNATPMCFHISHSSLLDAILDFCRVPTAQHAVTKDILGKLHIGTWTWQKIRSELRAPAIGVSASSIDDLTRFDFRDTPEKALKRLQALFKDTKHLPTIHKVFTHISGLNEYLKRFGVRRKVYLSPLSSLNDKFYRSSVMFQCLFDTKKRDIFAAGGRYDSLIQALSPQHLGSSSKIPHAVGTNIAWDRLVTSMARLHKQSGTAYLKKREAPAVDLGQWTARRCDVLVASFDAVVLRSTGIRLVAELRASDIKAELAVDARSTDELLIHYGNDRHSWLVTIKHEGFTSGKPDLKVRLMETKGESADIQRSELANYIRGEIRERDEKRGTSDRARLLRQASQPEGPDDERKGDVHVLIASHKSKKTNKARVIQDAQDRVKELLASYTAGPIAAIEVRDEVLEKLRDTKLSDPDSWRRVIQSIPVSERQYCHELLDLIESFKTQYGESSRKCFIYNFRTGYCIDYDLWI